jgi:phosphomannomutase
MAALAGSDRSLSQLLADFSPYSGSGEINTRVDDQAGVVARVEQEYAAQHGVSVDHLDGLTVEHADWWFNVRASNTEPLLRLNVEGRDEPTMARVRDRVLSLVRST